LQKLPWLFSVSRQGSQRIIYFKKDIFPGIDPSGPLTTTFSIVWDDVIQFLQSVHPISKTGRFGFAEFLRERGPASIKGIALAKMAQLVQQAVNQQLLKFDKNILSTNIEYLGTKDSDSELNILNCIEQVLTQHYRVQIGGLSAVIEKRGFMPHVKAKGGMKTYIQSIGTYQLDKDNNNGLWVVHKQPIKVLNAYVKQHGSVNIGTLSGFAQQVGMAAKLKTVGGLKSFMESSGLFEFESKEGGTYVKQKSSEKSFIENTGSDVEEEPSFFEDVNDLTSEETEGMYI